MCDAETRKFMGERYLDMYGSEDLFIGRVQTRQKSAQGRVEKLAKIICYDEHNPKHKKRSIVDIFAVLASVRLVSKKFHDAFQSYYGMTPFEAARPVIVMESKLNRPDTKITEEKWEHLQPIKQVQYSVLGLFMHKGFEMPHKLDDKTLQPKKNGYSSLQTNVLFKRKLFEIVTKPEEIAVKETIHGSGFFHPTYHDVENEIWLNSLDTKVEPEVVKKLWSLLGNQKKFFEDIKMLESMRETK